VTISTQFTVEVPRLVDICLGRKGAPGYIQTFIKILLIDENKSLIFAFLKSER
jgi:hypothetical protein